MFKKFCLVIVVVLVSASVSFAGEEVIVFEGAVAPQWDIGTDVYVYRSHICASTSSNCAEADKYVSGTPRLRARFWAPSSQFYERHMIVTDTKGTIVDYVNTNTSLTSGMWYVWADRTLAAGDYVFVFIVVGADRRAAVSDPFRFTVF